MRNILVAVVVVGAVLLLGYYFFGLMRPSVPKKAQARIGDKLFDVEIADNMFSRMRGLSGHVPLSDTEGMFFVFSSSSRHGFWMKDMTFPIDIVWISGGSVVGFEENAMPEPAKNIFQLTVYYPPSNINKVLEINSGLVKKYGIKVGDAVSLTLQ